MVYIDKDPKPHPTWTNFFVMTADNLNDLNKLAVRLHLRRSWMIWSMLGMPYYKITPEKCNVALFYQEHVQLADAEKMNQLAELWSKVGREATI